jgi:hypothetical protein
MPLPNGYPTREEILARELKFKRGTLAAAKAWKRDHYDGQWAAKTVEQKLASLCELVDVLDGGRRTVRVTVGDLYCYHPATRTITLDGRRPSIVSTIHEMGHHVRPRGDHRESELEACRYSVWMFRKVFPRAYERLNWRGHMLVQ